MAATVSRIGVVFEIVRQCEDMDPSEQFDDPETLAWVREQIAQGNEWAWCAVQVVAHSGDRTATSSWLGGCSYENRQSFESGGYYDDLCSEAFEALAHVNTAVSETSQ